jgi:hypothetical protein
MPKQKPLQGGEPIRGGDTSIVAEAAYDGNIPVPAFLAIERELAGLAHGTASITFHIRDGKLVRYETERRISYMPEAPAEGDNEKTKQPSCQ